jgi:two-component system response regulator HydG
VILTREDYVPFSELPEAIRGASGDDLSKEVREGLRTGMTIREMERELIMKTLDENDGNRTHSSRILGITRRTLQHKLKEYGIDHGGADMHGED